jgi:AraC-like DNA-binding protein
MDFYIEHHYAEQLYPFVKKYIIMKNPQRLQLTSIDFKSTGSVYLLIVFQGMIKLQYMAKEQYIEPGCYIGGQVYREHIQLNLNNCKEFILVELNPVTLYQALEVPLLNYTDKFTPVHLVGMKFFLEEVKETSTGRLKIKLVVSFLRSFLPFQKIISDRVFLLCQWIDKQNEMIKVETIADFLNCSERQVERVFQQKIGLSPKYYLKCIQMRQVVNMVMEKGNKPFVDILYEKGHYDAPHFSKDFKRLMRMTPLEFFKQEALFDSMIMKLRKF